MKRLTLLLLFSLSLLASKAQEESPVHWTFEISDTTNIMGLYELNITAQIDEHWHMYSQNLPSPEEGPLPTEFHFEPSGAYTIVGKTAEVIAPISKFDDVFEVQVNYFDKKAEFKQLVSLKNKTATVKGYVSYMVCNESTCLPPIDVPFELKVEK